MQNKYQELHLQHREKRIKEGMYQYKTNKNVDFLKDFFLVGSIAFFLQ